MERSDRCQAIFASIILCDTVGNTCILAGVFHDSTRFKLTVELEVEKKGASCSDHGGKDDGTSLEQDQAERAVSLTQVVDVFLLAATLLLQEVDAAAVLEAVAGAVEESLAVTAQANAVAID